MNRHQLPLSLLHGGFFAVKTQPDIAAHHISKIYFTFKLHFKLFSALKNMKKAIIEIKISLIYFLWTIAVVWAIINPFTNYIEV